MTPIQIQARAIITAALIRSNNAPTFNDTDAFKNNEKIAQFREMVDAFFDLIVNPKSTPKRKR